MSITGCEVTYIDDRVLSWTPAPPAPLECHSHAITVEGRTWLIDPIDVPGLEDVLATRPEIAGVIVLFDRHLRDSVQIADRHDVPVWVPEGVSARSPRAGEYDTAIDDLPFAFIDVSTGPKWRERALWWQDERILICADCIGTAHYYRVRRERAAVHPMLRAIPPKQLRTLDPELLCVGHGRPLAVGATEALHEAVGTARSRIPWLLASSPTRLLHWRGAARTGC